jgi:hypothetical protein
VGKHNTVNFQDLSTICSLGKSKVNRRKARGVIAEIAKLILPQNKIEEDCFKTYSMKTVNPHPAQAQARTEKVNFTRL